MDRIRLIASDMDATLLDEYSQLPPKFTETIRALAGQGILFAAASGQASVHTGNDVPGICWRRSFSLATTAALPAGRGKTCLCPKCLPRAGGSWPAAQSRPETWAFCADCRRPTRKSRTRRYDAVFKNFYTRVEYVDDLTAVEAAADKFTVYLPNDDSQKAFDRTYGAFHTGNGGAFSVAVAGRNWVDVMNPGVHKGAALAKVGALLGIPADSMMAFGDTYNDAEMLTTAKYGFLMENGSGPLRAQVPFLAPSHREYGVMQVLKQVLRQNGEVSPEDFVKAH